MAHDPRKNPNDFSEKHASRCGHTRDEACGVAGGPAGGPVGVRPAVARLSSPHLRTARSFSPPRTRQSDDLSPQLFLVCLIHSVHRSPTTTMSHTTMSMGLCKDDCGRSRDSRCLRFWLHLSREVAYTWFVRSTSCVLGRSSCGGSRYVV